MTPDEFEADLARAREAAGARRAAGAVLGYRLADGWFEPDDLWALDVLAEDGLRLRLEHRPDAAGVRRRAVPRGSSTHHAPAAGRLGSSRSRPRRSSASTCRSPAATTSGSCPQFLMRRAVARWDRDVRRPARRCTSTSGNSTPNSRGSASAVVAHAGPPLPQPRTRWRAGLGRLPRALPVHVARPTTSGSTTDPADGRARRAPARRAPTRDRIVVRRDARPATARRSRSSSRASTKRLILPYLANTLDERRRPARRPVRRPVRPRRRRQHGQHLGRRCNATFGGKPGLRAGPARAQPRRRGGDPDRHPRARDRNRLLDGLRLHLRPARTRRT